MTFLQIENYIFYYWLMAGIFCAGKECIYYFKYNKTIDSIFIGLALTCFAIGFMLLPIQAYNYLHDKFNKK